MAVFLPAVRALAAVPTVVVAELAVVVPANRADLAGDGRLFNRAVIAVAAVIVSSAVGFSGRCRGRSGSNNFRVLINHSVNRELVGIEIQLVISGVIRCIQNIYDSPNPTLFDNQLQVKSITTVGAISHQ